MNLTISVRGVLEDDVALQEIVTILNRKVASERGGADAAPPAPGAEAPAKPEGGPQAPAVPRAAPAPAEKEPQAPAERPGARAVGIEDVRRASMAAMDAGKRAGVKAVIDARGGRLSDMAEADLAEVLAEIEAL